MTKADHHLKYERLASYQPFENGTILNQNIKAFGIGMAFGCPSLVFEPPLHPIAKVPSTR